jgi:predicted Zn-dependent peptidase
MPGRERVMVAAAGFGVGLYETKLPTSLAMPDLGWRAAHTDDPLGVLAGGPVDGYRIQVLGGGQGGRGRDAAIDRQLGFLDAPAAVDALRSFTLPSGITVRVRREPGAATAAVTVRIATVEDVSEGPSTAVRLARRGAEIGAVEALHTITVDRADAEAAVELGAARLRLALGDTASSQLAEIRFHAGAARRKALAETPYGQSWLALGEALFPPDHPLSGTVLGAAQDSAALRDLMIAESMRRERALARASLTIVGDVDESRARKLAEAFLGSVSAPVDAPIGPHPREDRVTVQEDVPSPRVLIGWIGPGEGEVGDASLRVAMEMLENPKVALLQHALVDRFGVASLAHAGLEAWPRASIASIEIAPSSGHEPAEAVRVLDTVLAHLAEEGPESNQVALAKYFVHARLQKDQAAITALDPGGKGAKPRASVELVSGAVHSASLARLHHALRPWATERALKTLDEVTVATVRAAVKRILAPDHRVIVTTVPRAR